MLTVFTLWARHTGHEPSARPFVLAAQPPGIVSSGFVGNLGRIPRCVEIHANDHWMSPDRAPKYGHHGIHLRISCHRLAKRCRVRGTSPAWIRLRICKYERKVKSSIGVYSTWCLHVLGSISETHDTQTGAQSIHKRTIVSRSICRRQKKDLFYSLQLVVGTVEYLVAPDDPFHVFALYDSNRRCTVCHLRSDSRRIWPHQTLFSNRKTLTPNPNGKMCYIYRQPFREKAPIILYAKNEVNNCLDVREFSMASLPSHWHTKVDCTVRCLVSSACDWAEWKMQSICRMKITSECTIPSGAFAQLMRNSYAWKWKYLFIHR